MHSWQARPCNQTSPTQPTGCPCCVGKKPCKCNSLETVCPDIAADFDVEKNGVTAAQVTSSTGTKYSSLSDEPGAKKRWQSARSTQGNSLSLTLDAPNSAANSDFYCVFEFLCVLVELQMAC